MIVLAKAKRIEDERRHNEIAGTLKNIEQINKEGFERTVSAVKENTEVTREGFQKTVEAVDRNTSAVKENTQVTKEGFEKTVEAVDRTTSAVQENTDVTKDGFNRTVHAVNETTTAVNKNTEATKDGFKRVETHQKEANKLHTRNNAIQVAMAKKQGINLRDSSWFRFDKIIKYAASDVMTGVTGRDSIEAEVAKEN